MIQGRVTPTLDAIVPLLIRSDRGNDLTVEAVVDTGFNDYLTLPSDMIVALGLPRVDTVFVKLGDGTIIKTDVFVCRVLWDGTERIVTVQEATEGSALVGMQLLLGSLLTLQVWNGGTVTIELKP